MCKSKEVEFGEQRSEVRGQRLDYWLIILNVWLKGEGVLEGDEEGVGAL